MFQISKYPWYDDAVKFKIYFNFLLFNCSRCSTRLSLEFRNLEENDDNCADWNNQRNFIRRSNNIFDIFWYFSTTFYYLHTLLTMMHRWTDDQSEMKWKQRRMEVCRSWLGTVDRLQSGTFFNLTQIQSNISLFLRSHSTTSRLILEHTSVIAGAQRKRLLILFLALPIFLFLCLFYTRSTISLAQELKRLNKWASQCQKRVDERCAMSRKFCS